MNPVGPGIAIAIVPLGSTSVSIAREYNSLVAQQSGRLGNGWRVPTRDVDVQLNVPLTGREEFGIYMVGDSRFNVAGLPADGLDDLAKAVAAVL